MCHSSTRPDTSYHVTQFYQAFPRISTASDKRGARRPRYEAKCSPLIGQTVVVVIHNTHADYFVYRHTQSVRPELTDSDEHEDLRGLETLMEGEPKQQHRMLGTGGEWERSARRCGGKCDEVRGRC